MTVKPYESRWNRRLTRYFSFARFVDFLSKGLFCAKATLFEDPWEGHVFHSITAATENREALAAFVESVLPPPCPSCSVLHSAPQGR